MFSAISVRNLRKLYGTKAAVDGLDLEVPRGSFFGFLGPNGAGKTTTIRMLMGLAPPSSGSIELLGLPMPERGLEVKDRRHPNPAHLHAARVGSHRGHRQRVSRGGATRNRIGHSPDRAAAARNDLDTHHQTRSGNAVPLLCADLQSAPHPLRPAVRDEYRGLSWSRRAWAILATVLARFAARQRRASDQATSPCGHGHRSSTMCRSRCWGD